MQIRVADVTDPDPDKRLTVVLISYQMSEELARLAKIFPAGKHRSTMSDVLRLHILGRWADPTILYNILLGCRGQIVFIGDDRIFEGFACYAPFVNHMRRVGNEKAWEDTDIRQNFEMLCWMSRGRGHALPGPFYHPASDTQEICALSWTELQDEMNLHCPLWLQIMRYESSVMEGEWNYTSAVRRHEAIIRDDHRGDDSTESTNDAYVVSYQEFLLKIAEYADLLEANADNFRGKTTVRVLQEYLRGLDLRKSKVRSRDTTVAMPVVYPVHAVLERKYKDWIDEIEKWETCYPSFKSPLTLIPLEYMVAHVSHQTIQESIMIETAHGKLLDSLSDYEWDSQNPLKRLPVAESIQLDRYMQSVNMYSARRGPAGCMDRTEPLRCSGTEVMMPEFLDIDPDENSLTKEGREIILEQVEKVNEVKLGSLLDYKGIQTPTIEKWTKAVHIIEDNCRKFRHFIRKPDLTVMLQMRQPSKAERDLAEQARILQEATESLDLLEPAGGDTSQSSTVVEESAESIHVDDDDDDDPEFYDPALD